MKIGKVERCVLLLLNQHSVNASVLSIILRAQNHRKTGPSVRRAIKTLKLKGLLDHSNKLTHLGAKYLASIKNEGADVVAGELDFDVMGDGLKLGMREKILLYVLSKIEHASLQFLAMVTKQNSKNVSAVLNRLEKNGLVYGYRSMITFTNIRGRRYRPKYYRITGLGMMVSAAIRRELSDKAGVMDELLEDTLKVKSEMSKNSGALDKNI